MTFIYHWLKTPSFCFKNGKKNNLELMKKLPKIMMIKVLKLLNFGESWKKGKDKKGRLKDYSCNKITTT